MAFWQVAFILTLLAIGFVLWPLLKFKRKSWAGPEGYDETQADLYAEHLADLEKARLAGDIDITAGEAIDLLAGADTIYLAGLRRSFPITSYMAYAMGKLGIRSILVDGIAGLGAEQTGFITGRDAMLAVSFTPYASETVALATAARANGARIVAITDSLFSPLAPLSDVWLEVVEANFEGFRSMAATMALAMTLTVAVAGKRSERT